MHPGVTAAPAFRTRTRTAWAPSTHLDVVLEQRLKCLARYAHPRVHDLKGQETRLLLAVGGRRRHRRALAVVARCCRKQSRSLAAGGMAHCRVGGRVEAE